MVGQGDTKINTLLTTPPIHAHMRTRGILLYANYFGMRTRDAHTANPIVRLRLTWLVYRILDLLMKSKVDKLGAIEKHTKPLLQLSPIFS